MTANILAMHQIFQSSHQAPVCLRSARCFPADCLIRGWHSCTLGQLMGGVNSTELYPSSVPQKSLHNTQTAIHIALTWVQTCNALCGLEMCIRRHSVTRWLADTWPEWVWFLFLLCGVPRSGWCFAARACPECVQRPTMFSHWGEPVR